MEKRIKTKVKGYDGVDKKLFGYSPLFDPICNIKDLRKEDDGKKYVDTLRVGYDESNRRLDIKSIKEPLSDTYFTSIKDIHDHLIKSLPCDEKKLEAPDKSYYPLLINVFINQAANAIAACTRMGAGNVVLAGSKVIDIIRTACIKSDNIPTSIVYENTYEFIGYLNGIPVYEDENIDQNTIIVTYKGKQGDKGVILTKDKKNGVFHYNELENNNECIANYSDYFRVIKIV